MKNQETHTGAADFSTPASNAPHSRLYRWVFIVAAAWLMVVGAGTAALIQYSNTPGVSANPPAVWPPQTRLKLSAGTPTLLMFIHPHCPCTHASLTELEELLARFPNKVATCLVFVKPPGTDSNWEYTSTWRAAARIPNVSVYLDNGGAEAFRFRTATSGETLLYGTNKKLLFDGGITPGRGHEGDSPGLTALGQILAGEQTQINKTPVFGCPLTGACPKN